jgi:hypothetical protein
MAALGAIIFVAGAGFGLVVVVTIVVIIGIRQEERYMTLENRSAPGAMAQLARVILGRYVRKEQHGATDRDEPNGSREHSTSSRS